MDKWWESEIRGMVGSSYSSAFDLLLPRVGDIIGSGDQGYVFEYEGGRAIKFVEGGMSKKVFKAVQRIKSPHVVGVAFYGGLGHSYYYVMERLRPLRDDEWSYFYATYRFENEDNRKSIKNVRALKLTNEIERLGKLGLWYVDMHYGNVMKNSKVWKLIDLEGFSYLER